MDCSRLPCPSPSPRACSNSCALNQWCHPTISSSAVSFFCLQSFPASGSFLMSQLFASSDQSIRALASLIAQLVKNPPAMQETPVQFLVGKILWRRDRSPTPVFFGFPCGSAGKESACNVGDLGSIPGLRRSPGKGKGYPLQYSGLENSMVCIVHRVAKSWIWLSDFH